MHRTQISLEEQQYKNLQRYALRENLSISAVIRELLDKHLPPAPAAKAEGNPLLALKGMVSGKGKTRGRDHNDVLYSHEKRWNEGKP